jgi:tRNA pseudouridine13 synthase
MQARLSRTVKDIDPAGHPSLNTVDSPFKPIPAWHELPTAWGGPLSPARFRIQPEDFQVFEVPLVAPGGEGEHCWLHVRKRNSNTQWVARQLARFAGVSPSAVSYAGLKDRKAVTEQWFSVQLPGRPDPDWKSLQHEDFEVLRAARHHRKLKTGALKGNRFRLRIRNVNAADGVDQRLQQLACGGFPNYFGPQRFGRDAGNLAEAVKLFTRPGSRLPRHKRGLYLSAVRSALFNQVLAARVGDDCWNTAMPGDALQLEGKSACFVAEAIDEQIDHRLQALEVHPTGPLCGDGEVLVRGQAAQYEAGQLQAYGGWIEGLQRFRVAAARRALRVLPGDLKWRLDADGSWLLEFSLAAGCYATSLLREVFDVDSED